MKGIDRATYSCNRDSTRRSCNVLAEEGRLWSKIGAAALLTVKVFVAVVASCALVGIACWVNYDSAKDSGESLTAYAIASCILAAMSWIVVFSENVPLKGRIFAGVVVAFFTAQNLVNTIGNIASVNDRGRDASVEQFKAQTRRDDRIEELKAARLVQTGIAKEVSAATFAAQLAGLKATGLGKARWEGYFSTDHCSPAHTTTQDEKELCRQVGDLEVKKAAAEARDKIDAERAELTRKEITPQRSRADSQVTAIASFARIGIEDGARREAISHGLDFLRGFGIQMLGECGPRIVLFFLFVAFNAKEAERRREERRKDDARRRAERTQKVKPIVAVEVEPQLPELQPEETNGSDPEVTAFLTRSTTRVTGGRVPSKSLYKTWCEDCAERGVKPGTQYAFSKRVANFVNREGKNNRYTWLGIALKHRDAAPKLRVVAA